MNKNENVCFQLEGKALYIDQVLIRFNDIPFFFVCTDYEDYYTVLCYDVKVWKYYIAKNTSVNITKMLLGKLPIRSMFSQAEELWNVSASDNARNDFVEKISYDDLDKSALPANDEYYEILDNDVRAYTNLSKIKNRKDKIMLINNFLKNFIKLFLTIIVCTIGIMLVIAIFLVPLQIFFNFFNTISLMGQLIISLIWTSFVISVIMVSSAYILEDKKCR